MADPLLTPVVSPPAPERTWRESQRLRDELFERAKFGRITGEQADAEAERLGLGSLSRRPDATAFDPVREDYWTLPMAVAWIAYRNSDAVREAWDRYCAECWHWVWQKWRVGFDGDVHEGWHLEQWQRPTLARLALSEAFDRADVDNGKPPIMTVEESCEALWSALREGFFAASAVDTQSGRRVEISALDWHELVAVQGRAERDEVRFGLMGNGYADVLIPSAALRGFWRAPAETHSQLPETIRPDGDGYMPLYCAAHWIATEGGKREFSPCDEEIWRDAYAQLLAAITSEKVRVVGLRDGERNLLLGHLFAGVAVDYPFCSADVEIMAGPELHLRSYPYVDEEHWRGGFDDALVSRGQSKWTRLMVDKAAVRQRWPFEAALAPRSGALGRPTSSHLFSAEMERRATLELLEVTLAAESRALSAWLAHHHPAMPQAKPKAIQEVIRERYWQLKRRK
jgi:hypothetical protein